MMEEKLVKFCVYHTAEAYLLKWFNEKGIEATIEMILRNKEQSVTKIYIELLQDRGLLK
jgi:hypothetical protein